jgi:signal-transduction protein with cAMP-binding, CBS, and nucleotidyltransferase domain
MRIYEVMHTPVVTCRPTATLGEVAALMEQHNVGSVVVVDRTGFLTGIVTDRDLALRGLGSGRSREASVDTVMTRDVATVTPTAAVFEAATIMQKKGVRRVPVVDDWGALHGVVTFDDLVVHLGHETDALTDALMTQRTTFCTER